MSGVVEVLYRRAEFSGEVRVRGGQMGLQFHLCRIVHLLTGVLDQGRVQLFLHRAVCDVHRFCMRASMTAPADEVLVELSRTARNSGHALGL